MVRPHENEKVIYFIIKGVAVVIEKVLSWSSEVIPPTYKILLYNANAVTLVVEEGLVPPTIIGKAAIGQDVTYKVLIMNIEKMKANFGSFEIFIFKETILLIHFPTFSH